MESLNEVNFDIKGPVPISEVDTHITRSRAGVYILSRDGKVAHYIGQSNTDIARRIKSQRSKGYSYFWYTYTPSAIKAYYIECIWYHTYNPTDNVTHPSPPPGTFWRCPVNGCPWSRHPD